MTPDVNKNRGVPEMAPLAGGCSVDVATRGWGALFCAVLLSCTHLFLQVLLRTSILLSVSPQGRSPLLTVKWLRVVLDEGHIIRNPSAQMSKAAHALNAERRWVVTGTPIQNSMKDLWSLICFLKLEPFTDRQWWRRSIERPLSEGDKGALG